ncbi:MAG: hypothetical protein ABII90_08445 [Bacteroidota bacterium]
MKIKKVDIKSFQSNKYFYGSIQLLLTVKSFELQAIRRRYLASRKNVSGRVGSVERRQTGIGGIVKLIIKNGIVTEAEILNNLQEPRGIAFNFDKLAIAAEDKVYIITDKDMFELNNPWFSYIHSVDFSNDGKKILISSSGFDSIFEYDLLTGKKTFEWFAWEHGFNKANDPESGEMVTLTRDREENEKLIKKGTKVKLITDPAKQYLPTAMRSAFINSVVYDNTGNNRFLATFFHEGAIYDIDSISGNAWCVLAGLKSPHGGRRFMKKYMATSTGSGEVVVGNSNDQLRYDFNHLPGKPTEMENLEWLQNSIIIDDIIVTIDSNRTSFIIFNPKERVYDTIAYDDSWAIQDMINAELSIKQEEKVRLLGIR